MKLKITISLDNAAFGEDPHEKAEEVNRILRDLSGKLSHYGIYSDTGSIALFDVNGNRVGSARVE